MIDIDGHIKMISPVTGTLYSGPQVIITEERDASGNVTGLGVIYIGTNSLVDVMDYPQLNSSELSTSMGPILELVKDYALSPGLDGSDVPVTGYSLGGACTNIMAEYSDTLAGGFRAQSDYIAHASPVIFDGKDLVLNVGYENDTVFRGGGDYKDFLYAVSLTDPFVANSDPSYVSSIAAICCSAPMG